MTSVLRDDIASLLVRKRQLDQTEAATNRMASYDGWMVEAMELLLRLEFERQLFEVIERHHPPGNA